MKKIFTIFCTIAIALCASAAPMAPKAQLVKKAPAAAGQMLEKRQAPAHRSVASARKMANATLNTAITIGTFSATTAYEGEYYVVLTDAASTTQFIFDISTSVNPFELGKTYTLADMIEDYTFIGDADDWYACTIVVAASYTETVDQDGLTHVVASMTDEDGNVYDITYDQPEPQEIDVTAVDWFYDGEYYDVYIASETTTYLIELNEDLEYGKDYTYADMYPYWVCTLTAMGTPDITATDATLKVTKDENDLIHIEATMVLNGDTHNITYDEQAPADVYLSGDILIIDEVWNMSTGEVTGWNYTMHEPSVDNVMLRTTSTDKYGTFSFEDGTLTDQIYNITRVTEQGYEQYSFVSGSMTIAEVGDSIVLEGMFLCEDGKTYALHFTHLKSALNEDTDMDFDADYEYYQMSSYLNGGTATITVYGRAGRVNLELYVDPEATKIPAGVYPLSDTQEAGTALASIGVVNREITGCYAATLNTYTGDLRDLWFMTGGTITLDYDEYGRLTVAVEATNSYGRNAHITIAYQPIEPVDTVEINNTSLFITTDAQRTDIYDYMIYDEYGYLLAALMVKTDTLCGEFGNAVDLPQCAIKVPGAIVPYYLIDAKPFTVSGEGKELSINVSVLAADTILYVISGTGYIGAIFPDTKDIYNGQYTAEDINLAQVEDGIVELSGTNADNDDLAIVFWATLKEDGTLAAGEYTEIMPSIGISEEGGVAPSVVIDADSHVWLIQSGKLTVAADGSIAFEGLNSFDKEVKITISPATGLQEIWAHPTATKFFDGRRMFIRQANKIFDMVGRELR